MKKDFGQSTAMRWARFRFSVVGSLLSSPPARGELKAALECLAAKTWTHPVSGREVRFAAKTIERWLYRSRQERDDPVGVLRRAVRKDCGKVSLKPELIECLDNQYRDYPHWTYQLHYDNLRALVKADETLGSLQSYSTLRRYMVAQGMIRKPRLHPKGRPGELLAAQRRERREIRSYETEYVGSLWHLDFHHGSLKVVTPRGRWERPLALGILDDHSRFGCHLQWYLTETTEDLVHGTSQAIQKCGLPRALMTDNGSAMLAEEFTQGLLQLGIQHETTLPYSAYQNGKQERFWAHLEGRLMEMLGKLPELTLDFLNQATQAWLEIEYNRSVHREIGCSPATRFANARDVLRPSPSSNTLREAFRLEVRRRQRHGDGTISGQGLRGSSDLHAFGDSNLYLRRVQQRLVLISEHRAAPASPAVTLELVATDAATTHLEVVAEPPHDRPGNLREQVLACLVPGETLTRARLRDLLSVQNQRLGESLEALERAGQIRRTEAGWRRVE